MDWVFHLKIQFQPGHETNPRSHHHRKRCDFRIILSKDSTYRGGDNKINVNINLELERFSETASANAGKKNQEKNMKKTQQKTVTFCGLQVTSGPLRPATLGSCFSHERK